MEEHDSPVLASQEQVMRGCSEAERMYPSSRPANQLLFLEKSKNDKGTKSLFYCPALDADSPAW